MQAHSRRSLRDCRLKKSSSSRSSTHGSNPSPATADVGTACKTSGHWGQLHQMLHCWPKLSVLHRACEPLRLWILGGSAVVDVKRHCGARLMCAVRRDKSR